ncbi:DUF488 family protein [Micromonospora sp. NPDC050795]|uniref:DUF488 family protein n=1 Tax=Micromonospora sp. NPDC050795 TaxID=3364282 RepID=UPI0037ABF446
MSYRAGILGVGYEGRSIDEFVTGLADMGVTRLVDVRMTPISRKRGFSKSALCQALAPHGIVYEHRRELANPRESRPGFAGNLEGAALLLTRRAASCGQAPSLDGGSAAAGSSEASRVLY